MLWEGSAAALSVVAVWLLCAGARRALLTPLRLGEHLRLTVLLRSDGRAEELEETVEALRFLRDRGVLPGDVVVLDEGMDEETRRTAEEIAARTQGVKLWKKETSSS